MSVNVNVDGIDDLPIFLVKFPNYDKVYTYHMSLEDFLTWLEYRRQRTALEGPPEIQIVSKLVELRLVEEDGKFTLGVADPLRGKQVLLAVPPVRGVLRNTIDFPWVNRDQQAKEKEKMQEKIFRHEISFTDNTETMVAEGFLETRTETPFIRIVNEDLYPVLTVRRDRIDYIKSTPVHDSLEPEEGNTVRVHFVGRVTEVNGDWIHVFRDDTGTTLPPGAPKTTNFLVHKRFIKVLNK